MSWEDVRGSLSQEGFSHREILQTGRAWKEFRDKDDRLGSDFAGAVRDTVRFLEPQPQWGTLKSFLELAVPYYKKHFHRQVPVEIQQLTGALLWELDRRLGRP